MPLIIAQQNSLNSLKCARQSSVLNRPQTPISDQPQEAVRHSGRKRRPSTHELESQEYQARMRALSQSPSPSRQQSSTQSKRSLTPTAAKLGNKPKKHPFGMRGNRPGRITQPAAKLGPTGLPEPVVKTDSELHDILVETQRNESIEVVHISLKKAIRLATKHLGQDALTLSKETLKEVLQQIPLLDKETGADPLDTEGGNPTSQPRSAAQTVLGGGQQPSANGVTDDVNPAHGANAQLGSAPRTPELKELALVEPVDDEPAPDEMDGAENSEMEPEPNTEFLELGPGDSVSQRPHNPGFIEFNPAPCSIIMICTPPSRQTKLALTPYPKRMDYPDDANEESDTATIDSDKEVAHASKRQRVEPSQTRQPPKSLQLGILRPTSAKILPLPLRAARHMLPSSTTSRQSRIPPMSIWQGLSKPPPSSDIKSALAWAVDFAKQEVRSRATTSHGVDTSHQSGANFSLLAQVLGEVHALLDSTPLLQSKAQPGLNISRPSTDFISNHVAVLEAKAAIALGKRPRVRKQPALSDYPGLTGQIASLAIPELIATAIAKGPYSCYATNDDWAIDMFREVAGRQTGGKEVEDPPRPLRSLMIRRISCFRGDALDRIRPLTCYRRGFISAPSTIDDLRHNIQLADTLLPNAFHCCDPEHEVDPYEDPTIKEYIAVALFWGPDSLSVVFHKKLYPLSIPFLAFVLTLMQHSIGEWKSGRYVKTELDAKLQVGMYESHMLGLLAYEQEANGRFEEFREEAFWHGINHAGVSDELHEPYQPVTQANKIRPDSPRTRARAKGKARALH